MSRQSLIEPVTGKQPEGRGKPLFSMQPLLFEGGSWRTLDQ
jgi:hypothetical protein